MREGRLDPVQAMLLAVTFPVGALLVGSIVGAQAIDAAGVGGGSFAGLVGTTLAYQGIGVATVAGLYYRWRGDPIEHLGLSLPGRRELRWAGGGVTALVGLWFGVSVLARHLGVPPAGHQLGALSEPGQILVFVALSFLVVAPGEEVLFRGLVQGTLREAVGPIPAIGGASALFALNHVTALVGAGDGPGMVVSLGLILLLSLVLGALYERTETIVVPVIVHGCFNGFQFGLRYLEVTGVL
jgi:membrane protease YdiL (CAAX protease family)